MSLCSRLLSLFLWKIAQGRNWARITFFILFLLGAPISFSLLPREFARSSLLGMLTILQTALQPGAFLLFFTTPGQQWFRSHPPVSVHDAALKSTSLTH